MTAPTPETAVEKLAAALAEHRYRDLLGDYEIEPYYKHFGCSCGWEQKIAGMSGWRSWIAAHQAHAAEAVLASGVVVPAGETGALTEDERESVWQQAWRLLADHQWGHWECSCGVKGEYEDNHLADVLSEFVAARTPARDDLPDVEDADTVGEGYLLGYAAGRAARDDLADKVRALADEWGEGVRALRVAAFRLRGLLDDAEGAR